MKSRILFFIANSYPTAAEFAAAARIPTEMFRNASAVRAGDCVEPCDGVAGKVPKEYRGFTFISTDEIPDAPVSPAVTVIDNPPDFLPQAAAVEAAASTDPVSAQRQAEDAGARGATSAQLRAALVQLGIRYPSNLNKAGLLALYIGRP